jgi:hypothetical protein
MLFIPSKYYYLKDKINVYHNTWETLIEENDLTYDDIDTMINTYHDSDSEKDYNPFYYIVNRPSTDEWYTKGEIFDKYNFK